MHTCAEHSDQEVKGDPRSRMAPPPPPTPVAFVTEWNELNCRGESSLLAKRRLTVYRLFVQQK